MAGAQLSDRSSKHVVVVGAGPGGLATAMLLSHQGMTVTLLERHPVPGGRTSTLSEHVDGVGTFRWDMGPTFFLYPRILEEVFAMCGRDLHAEHPMVRLDPQYRLQFEDTGGGIEHTLDCTADLEEMVHQISKIDPDDAQRFPRFIEDNRRKFDAFTPILQKGWRGGTRGLADYLDPTLVSMLPLVRPWASVDADLGRYFKNERIRLAFSFQSKYLGMSPFRCPSLFTILSYLEYDYGIYHPEGGCGAVSRTMARVAGELGATVELGAEVLALRFDDPASSRRCTGVAYRDADGATHELQADAVVVNADFAAAMRDLVPDGLRRRWTDAKLEKKKYSCSTFMMYLGVEGTYPAEDAAHHQIFLAHDYARNLDEIENRHVLSDNPSVYAHNPSVTDPSMAPQGHSSLYVLAPVTHQHDNVDWSKEAGPFRQRVLRQLEKMGYTGLEGRILCERTLTPDGWADDQRIYRGATFNLAHNLGQMLHLRPRNRFEDLDGVYLVGGGTHPGSGLPVIYEGARITARYVLEDLQADASWLDTAPATATPGYGTFANPMDPVVV